MKIEGSQPRILLVNCSPRPKNNTSILLDKAREGVLKVKGLQTTHFEFAGKTFEGCKSVCVEFCITKGRCVIKDDFAEFVRLWLEADGIIYGTPIYSGGPPGQVKCAFDRLGEFMFHALGHVMPRFLKPSGIIVQGGDKYGGQEIVAQYFVNLSLLMNCIPVSDMPDSYMAALGHSPSGTEDPTAIRKDKLALSAAESLGVRVAEMVKIIASGREASSPELPDVYWLERMRTLGEKGMLGEVGKSK